MSAGFAGQAAAAVAVPAAGVWAVAPAECTASFRVRDKLVGTAAGTIPVRGGTVRLGDGGAVRSARLELDTAGIDTGNRHRDKDLRTPRFLAAAEHPVIVVEAGPADPTAGAWDLAATLTARGATVPVELTVTLVTVDERAAQAHVTGRLDRTGLGMKVPTFVVGRMIDLDVRLVFRR